ncbi:hypothetical protein FLGE108171_14550 [Flavobacterium gelidilacus]|uniref:hypothetical protein n=1 Tax=Flavobacterium gelidilacus TaxID=206041 RepID=UPI00040FDA3B|nr:hypothetical protein [Flavobacterium gelidilacus]
MKVKILLALLLFITSININAQETELVCDFEYFIQAKEFIEELNPEVKIVNFKWDFSKLSASDQVSLEIIKIYDCSAGLDAIQTLKYEIINLKSKDFIDLKELKIKHIDMMAKCFKWRVIVKSEKCLKQSDWNYYSFLD